MRTHKHAPANKQTTDPETVAATCIEFLAHTTGGGDAPAGGGSAALRELRGQHALELAQLDFELERTRRAAELVLEAQLHRPRHVGQLPGTNGPPKDAPPPDKPPKGFPSHQMASPRLA